MTSVNICHLKHPCEYQQSNKSYLMFLLTVLEFRALHKEMPLTQLCSSFAFSELLACFYLRGSVFHLVGFLFSLANISNTMYYK